MSCEIIIRRAREEDAIQRAELIQMGLLSHQWNAFIYFLFQELTVECVLLSSAVLFIFCGASPASCALLLPAAAAFVALAVSLTHRVLASSHAQRTRQELYGLVAEVRGPLLLAAPAGPVPMHTALELSAQSQHAVHSKVVGTLSVSQYCGAGAGLGDDLGWLHALAVHPGWRRRGVGRALTFAAQQAAAAAGLRALEALTSELQHPARSLLHAQGWQCRGTYDRRLLGAALTLQLARLGLDLPCA